MSGISLDLPGIAAAHAALAPSVRETPIWPWRDDTVGGLLPPGTAPILKLELFQYAGSFKARGALSVMRTLARPAASATQLTPQSG